MLSRMVASFPEESRRLSHVESLPGRPQRGEFPRTSSSAGRVVLSGTEERIKFERPQLSSRGAAARPATHNPDRVECVRSSVMTFRNDVESELAIRHPNGGNLFIAEIVTMISIQIFSKYMQMIRLIPNSQSPISAPVPEPDHSVHCTNSRMHAVWNRGGEFSRYILSL